MTPEAEPGEELRFTTVMRMFTWVSERSEEYPGVLYSTLVRACSAEDCEKSLTSNPRTRGKNWSLDVIGCASVIEQVDKPEQLILQQIYEPSPSLLCWFFFSGQVHLDVSFCLLGNILYKWEMVSSFFGFGMENNSM